MMIKWVWIFLISAISINTFGQNCSDVILDNANMVYRYTDFEILKVNSIGDTLYRYSNNSLGKISYIDVTNPMKPLVFYNDAQKIAVLDNTLSLQNQRVINLEDIEAYSTQCVATSQSEQGFWLYDLELMEIERFDFRLQKKVSTGNLLQLLGVDELNVLSLKERSGFLFVTTEHQGVIIFDIYGTLYKILDFKNVQYLDVLGKNLILQNDNNLIIMPLDIWDAKPIGNIDVSNSDKVLFINEKELYICKNGKVETLSWTTTD